MTRIALNIILLLLLTAEFSIGSEILDNIRIGNIDEARKLISESETAVRRDGNLLYYQSLIETEGDKSYQFLTAAYKSGPDAQLLEEITYQMALYHFAERNYDKVTNTASTYLTNWEAGKYRKEILRLAAAAYDKTGDAAKADQFRRRLIRENDGSRYEALGKIDEAYSLYNDKKYLEAQKICRGLRSSAYQDVSVPALFMLSYYSVQQKRVDDAILYYNILKEGYPDAIGIDELVDKFGTVENRKYDTEAEKITGTVYSVQVGVFSVKKNAHNLADRMKAYGKKVDIEEKRISDKKYYVVFVGRFVSSDEAMAFKEKLEQTENEAYHVKAR